MQEPREQSLKSEERIKSWRECERPATLCSHSTSLDYYKQLHLEEEKPSLAAEAYDIKYYDPDNKTIKEYQHYNNPGNQSLKELQNPKKFQYE